MAYMRIEPFGAVRDDLRAGVIASTVATAAGAKGVRPDSFFGTLRSPEEPEAQEREAAWARRVLDVVRALTLTEGGTVKETA